MTLAHLSAKIDERTNTAQDCTSRNASSSITYPKTDPNYSTAWDHIAVVTPFDARASYTPTSLSFPHSASTDNIQSATQLPFGMGSLRTHEDPALSYDRQAASAYTNDVHGPFQPSLQAGSSVTYDDPARVYGHQHGVAYNSIESPYHTTDDNTATHNLFYPPQLSPAADTSPIYTTPLTNTPLAPAPTPCPYPNCAATFSRPKDLDRHYRSIHLGVRCHCLVSSCHNNHGYVTSWGETSLRSRYQGWRYAPAP